MNLRCTTCAHACCDQKKCTCSCHTKSFQRTNKILTNVMNMLGKQKGNSNTTMNFSWHSNILGSMMRLE